MLYDSTHFKYAHLLGINELAITQIRKHLVALLPRGQLIKIQFEQLPAWLMNELFCLGQILCCLICDGQLPWARLGRGMPAQCAAVQFERIMAVLKESKRIPVCVQGSLIIKVCCVYIEFSIVDLAEFLKGGIQ